MPAIEQKKAEPSVLDWSRSLAAEGLDPCVTRTGHCWVRIHRVCRFRYPCNDVAEIGHPERKELFVRHRALVISHHRLCRREEVPNAYLYLCRNPEYDLQLLSGNTRSKIRRGLKRHTIRRISPRDYFEDSYRCQADTRVRNGLFPQNEADYRTSWSHPGPESKFEYWAAYSNQGMAAYLIVAPCGKWCEIYNCGSSTMHLKDYPNHALFYSVLRDLLFERGFESVSYGLTSSQIETQAASLHSYKLSLGFEAVPIMRFVEVTPPLRVFVNRASRAAARAAERLLPRNIRVRKIRGVLEMMTGGVLPGLPVAALAPQIEPESDD